MSITEGIQTASNQRGKRSLRVPLTFKVLAPALTLSLLAAAILFAWQYSVLEQREENALRERMQIFLSTQSVQLSEAIWTFNQENVDRLFRSFEPHADLLSATLYDAEGGMLAQAKGLEVHGYAHTMSASTVLTRTVNGETFTLGRLEVVYHDGRLRATAASRLEDGLKTLALMVGILVLACSLVVHFQIGIPLGHLKKSLDRNTQTDARVPLAWSSNDELGDVAASYNLLLSDIEAKTHDLKLAGKVFENSMEGIVVTDPGGVVERVNPALTAITGYQPEEIIGRNIRLLKSDRHPDEFYQDMWEALLREGHWSGEVWNRRKDGETYPEWSTISAIKDPQGKHVHYVSVFRDITEIKRQQRTIEFLASHDALTGLPNRLLFEDRLGMAITQSRRQGSRLALLFLDLDNFKGVNDSLGHGKGDLVLKETAERIKNSARDMDTVYRQGGDEFIVILPEAGEPDDTLSIARRIVDAIGQPFLLEGYEVVTTASVGVTLCPDDGNDPADLLRKADLAMYRAKKQGGGAVHFFTQALDIQAKDRLTLEIALRGALDRDEFELFYQPVVDFASGRIQGAEALLRWRREGHYVGPNEFIPVAEETGLIMPIGAWVIAEACKQARIWRDMGFAPLTMAVNISGKQFSQQNFEGIIEKALDEHQLPQGHFHLEITESALIASLDISAERLRRVRDMGVEILLDDFGTGYSSLAYLKRLPVSGLKIDRSFVRELPGDPDSRGIAASVIAMARVLNLDVVAEGVEDRLQLAYLHAQGCGSFQGYLASPPVSAGDFKTFLEADRPLIAPATAEEIAALEDVPG